MVPQERTKLHVSLKGHIIESVERNDIYETLTSLNELTYHCQEALLQPENSQKNRGQFPYHLNFKKYNNINKSKRKRR